MTTNGRVAMVTGGVGIGRATALALLNEGYAVVLAGGDARRWRGRRPRRGGGESGRSWSRPT